MFLYNRHLHIPPEWSDTDKVLFQTCIRRPLYREYLPHERGIHRRFPIVSVTMCRFLPFVFFPRHIHDFLHNTLFLRSVNRFVRNLVLPSCLFSCYFDKMFHHFVPYAVLSCSAIKTPTVSCGGSSCGSILHWQPVFTIYNTASTNDRL